MDEIKRIGSPVVIDVSGKAYRVAVPLNRIPSPVWWVFFRDSGEWTSVCHPRSAVLDGSCLIFESEAEQVPGWIQYIDRWIASANGQFAVGWKRQQVERLQSGEEQRRRLLDAKSKFRHLS